MRNRLTTMFTCATLAALTVVDPILFIEGRGAVATARADLPVIDPGDHAYEVTIDWIKPFYTRTPGGDEVWASLTVQGIDTLDEQHPKTLFDVVQSTSEESFTSGKTRHDVTSYPQLGPDQFRVGWVPLEPLAEHKLMTHVSLLTINGPSWMEMSKKEKFREAKTLFSEALGTVQGALTLLGATAIGGALAIGAAFGRMLLEFIYLNLDDETLPDGHCDGTLVDVILKHSGQELFQLTNNATQSYTETSIYGVTEESWANASRKCGDRDNVPHTWVSVTYRRKQFLFADACEGNVELRPEVGAPSSYWFGNFGDQGNTWYDDISVGITHSDVVWNREFFNVSVNEGAGRCSEAVSRLTPFAYEEARISGERTGDHRAGQSCPLQLPDDLPVPTIPDSAPAPGPGILGDPLFWATTSSGPSMPGGVPMADTLTGMNGIDLVLYGAYDGCGQRRGSRLRYLRHDASGALIGDVMLQPSMEPPH